MEKENGLSAKISRGKALVRFSRYRDVWEAAPEENGFRQAKGGAWTLRRFASDLR
jgi:hypothetical protein